MASLTDLATILAEQDDYYAKNDPFLQGSQALYGGLKNIQDYNLSPWEKIAAGLVAGIGGGLMNGVGTARVDSKKQALAKSLSDLMTGADSDAIVKENPDAAKFLPTIQIARKQREMDSAAKLAEVLQSEEIKRRYAKPDVVEVGVGGRAKQKIMIDPYTGERLGDIGEAIPMDRPTVIHTGGGGADASASPQQQAALVRIMAGEKLTPEDMAALASKPSLVRMALGDQNSDSVSERFNKSLSNKEALSQIFGYEPVKPGTMLQPQIAKEYSKAVADNAKLQQILDQLGSGNLGAITGLDAAENAALSARLFNALRKETGSGAALSAGETAAIKAMMPIAASSDLTGSIKAGLLHMDQKELAKKLKERAQNDIDVELFGLGQKRSARPLETYPADLLKQFNVAVPATTPGTYGSSVTGGASPPYGSTVTLKDGSTATWDGKGYRRQ